MSLYIVSRTENNRTAIWPPFSSLERAKQMIQTHVKLRCDKEGDVIQREVDYTPAPFKEGAMVRVGGSEGHPVMLPAPECINCSVHETELLTKSGSRCLYRVLQTFVQE
jgi:hypothetical protein